MRSIANANPQNLTALNAISGMGPSKVDRYGAAILAVCRGESAPPPTPRPESRKPTSASTQETLILSAAKSIPATEPGARGPDFRTRVSTASSAVRENKRPTPPPPTPTELTPTQAALDVKLRDWRKQQAAQAGLPSFFILSDTALRSIALAEPRSLSDLAQIRGLDAEKRTRFGPAVLDLCIS